MHVTAPLKRPGSTFFMRAVFQSIVEKPWRLVEARAK